MRGIVTHPRRMNAFNDRLDQLHVRQTTLHAFLWINPWSPRWSHGTIGCAVKLRR